MYHRKLDVFVRNEDPPGKLGVDYEHFGQNGLKSPPPKKISNLPPIGDLSAIISEVDEELYDKLTQEPISPESPAMILPSNYHQSQQNLTSFDFKGILSTTAYGDDPSFEF